ncbi:MAG: hypothetical protein WAT46_13365 [Saprospiraceae bacterium]
MASLNDASTFIPRTDAFCFRYFLIRICIFFTVRLYITDDFICATDIFGDYFFKSEFLY